MDEADRAGELSGPLLEAQIAERRRAAASIPAGEPGECEQCGEESPRLVGGLCARCRDKNTNLKKRIYAHG